MGRGFSGGVAFGVSGICDGRVFMRAWLSRARGGALWGAGLSEWAWLFIRRRGFSESMAFVRGGAFTQVFSLGWGGAPWGRGFYGRGFGMGRGFHERRGFRIGRGSARDSLVGQDEQGAWPVGAGLNDFLLVIDSWAWPGGRGFMGRRGSGGGGLNLLCVCWGLMGGRSLGWAWSIGGGSCRGRGLSRRRGFVEQGCKH